ncbi:gas vesicle protein [Xanthobacter sediminis]
MSEPDLIPSRTTGEIAVADLLDRALHKGLVLWGEATISVAGVDLVYLGLKILLASTDTVDRMREAAAAPPAGRNLHAG